MISPHHHSRQLQSSTYMLVSTSSIYQGSEKILHLKRDKTEATVWITVQTPKNTARIAP